MFRGENPRELRRCGVLLLSITCVAALISCQRVAPAEEKIIGLWEFTGLDATGRVVFRRDHTVVDLFIEGDGVNARWIPTSWGKWRLEGSEIVTDREMLVGDYSSADRQITRLPIREIDEQLLVRADGRPNFTRVSFGIERYSQILALLYLVASGIALLACVYAIRRSSFRKGLILLAVAAAVAVVWSLLNLVADLAQTGSLIVSPASLRSLQLPRELLRVAWLLIFTTGLAKLAFALRARTSAKEAASDS